VLDESTVLPQSRTVETTAKPLTALEFDLTDRLRSPAQAG